MERRTPSRTWRVPLWLAAVALAAIATGCTCSEPNASELAAQPEIVTVIEVEEVFSVSRPLGTPVRAMAVTRFWGAPPDTGLRRVGTFNPIFFDGCGVSSPSNPDVAIVALQFADASSERPVEHVYYRSIPASLEAQLTERFGPPTELTISWRTRTWAALFTLWPYVVLVLPIVIGLVAAAVLVILGIVRRRRDQEGSSEVDDDPATVGDDE